MEQTRTRRKLDFKDFDAVQCDVECLATAGYDKVGNWDLSQVCGHLTEWMRFPLDGFPRPPLPMRLLLWTLRHTIAQRMLRQVVEQRTMPTGRPTLRETIPPSGDEKVAVEKFFRVIARFRDHKGPLHPSPLFGNLDHETATQLQLVHCAHHLSFLIPRSQ